MSALARSHSRLGPEGHMGHLITNALARPFLHLLIPTRAAQLMGREHPDEAAIIDRSVGREGRGHIVPVTDGHGTSYNV